APPATWYTANICYSLATQLDGYGAIAHGDSGGPVYRLDSSGRAIVVGVIGAVGNTSSTCFGVATTCYKTFYFTNMSTINNAEYGLVVPAY
ncbi:MAG: hypothetical protein QOG34_1371, partial [Frankiaceae bacterium]|nr:hypothetical protein [Frankiaceae bacterium]